MGLIPEITCRRCGNKYSGLKTRCPKCGAPRASQTTRTAATTASAAEGSAAYARAEVNGRWQLIFAGILAAAVILAVVVLVASGSGTSAGSATTGTSGSATTDATGVTVSDTYLPSPSPSAEPTPVGTEAPAITSIGLIFGDKEQTDITISNAGELQLQFAARTYPVNAGVTVEWSSDNESILTVDQTGLVTVVGADPEKVIHATITAKCGDVSASCIIYVPYYQASYLTNNAYAGAAAAATETPATTATSTPG